MNRLLVFAVLQCVGMVAHAQAFGSWARMLREQAEALHFQGRAVDDAFSEDLWKGYFEALDPGKVYFSEVDLAAFEGDRKSLGGCVRSGQGDFLERAGVAYRSCLDRADSLSQRLLGEPLDFQIKDAFVPAEMERPVWAKDVRGLEVKWRVRLKYRLLANIFDRYADAKGYGPEQVAELMGHAEAVQELIRKRLEAKFKRLREDADQQVGETFLEVLARSYDPHTAWFNPKGKDAFLASVSGEGESYGIQLEENKQGDIAISRVVPGGPGWRSGQLNAGDVLLRVQMGSGTEVDVSLLGMDEVMRSMYEADTDMMAFTVRKKDGQVVTVRLQKEKLRAEENLVKSFVLTQEAKVGYINLPGFYAEWDGGGKGCAGDVAKELIKLQRDGIQGLILDLRFNGGGAMDEAAELAGLFLDAGPLWIGKDKQNQRVTIKDPNRGAAYTGPLIVLVNGVSASASEFVCVALQDRGRAVIVGSPTYGKATSQSFFPVSAYGDMGKSGYLKLTTHKYYRLTGESHQVVGVRPDVELPDPLSRFVEGEGKLPHVLSNDTIVKKVYYEPMARPGLDGLRLRSAARMKGDASVQEMNRLGKALKAFFDSPTPVSLSPKDFFAWEAEYKGMVEEMDTLMKGEVLRDLKISGTQFDAGYLKLDAYSQELQSDLEERLRKDVLLGETLLIMNDLLKQ